MWPDGKRHLTVGTSAGRFVRCWNSVVQEVSFAESALSDRTAVSAFFGDYCAK